jgi:hypothetical protein
MLVFPVIGLLLWIAFLFAVVVLSGIVWTLCQVALGILGVIQRPGQDKRNLVARANATPGQRRVPAPTPPRAAPPAPSRAPLPAPARSPSEIWPKWTAAHRRYVDEELALWQEQFDALTSDRQALHHID